MAFREVRVFEVREVLRLWLRGEEIRSTERLAGVDRKTVRRYLAAAQELGVVHDGGEEQLRDELVGAVVEAVRPHRSDGHGEAWQLLVANHELIAGWLAKDDMTVRKSASCSLGEGSWCPSGPCTATRWRCATWAGADEGRRCASLTASPATNARWTSVASGWFPIRRSAGAACAMRWSSRRS